LDTVGKPGVVRVRAVILEGEHRDGRSSVCRSCGGHGPGALARVAFPTQDREGHTRNRQERRYHQQLGPTDSLPALLAVVPGQDEGDEEPRDEEDVDAPDNAFGNPPDLPSGIKARIDEKPARQIRERPLYELPLFQALEEDGRGNGSVTDSEVDLPTLHTPLHLVHVRLEPIQEILEPGVGPEAGEPRIKAEEPGMFHSSCLESLVEKVESQALLAGQGVHCRQLHIHLRGEGSFGEGSLQHHPGLPEKLSGSLFLAHL
jgi:hypothetical protein